LASRGTTFAKQDRDRAKKAKAAEKRERRVARAAGGPAEVEESAWAAPGEEVSAAALLRMVEELHQGYADGRFTLEEFDARKTELMARISVD